jgi:uncharacterized protein with HEPN domain
MSKRSISLLIEDIQEALDKMGRYIEGMSQDSFESDEKTNDAVVRNLEIIGEAAKCLHLSPMNGECSIPFFVV